MRRFAPNKRQLATYGSAQPKWVHPCAQGRTSMNSNQLLGHLTDAEKQTLQKASTELTIVRDSTLANPATHVLFPLSGMISLVIKFSDESQHEVGCVGSEGVSSAFILTSRYQPPVIAFGQIPGRAVSVLIETVRSLAQGNDAFRQALEDYAAQRYYQACVTAACNAHHNVPQRLAKWILTAGDRVQSQNVPLTHDYLAMMLGTRRATVTVAAQRFAEEGWITYRRGHIDIKNPDALLNASCECYGMNPFNTRQSLVRAAA